MWWDGEAINVRINASALLRVISKIGLNEVFIYRYAYNAKKKNSAQVYVSSVG